MAKKALKGSYVRNNSDSPLVVGELGILWQGAGAPDDTQFVPEDILDTSAPLQRMLHTLISGSNQTMLEVMDKESYNNQMEASSAAAKDEFGDLLSRPQDEGVLFCSAKDDNGEPICQNYTSDPGVVRPHLCTKHEYMREAIDSIPPEERERLKPQTRVMGPAAQPIEPTHVLSSGPLLQGMSLPELEAKVAESPGPKNPGEKK